MNREQRRAAAKNKDTSEVEEQVALFNKLPDECLTCIKRMIEMIKKWP